MKSFSSKRRWITAGILVVVMLFLFRPGASPLKSRIIASISSGLGKSVDLGAVHIRVLPRPGFDLKNLVVYDDASFGSEPMLRASEVSASLRLMSLVRGRIEIGRLDLTEPSLNLVRGENGRWNIETLLERTARTPLAPTAKTKSEPRPGFPYIDATSGRINFMVGREKKAFALTNADFSLWQDSENAWGVRLKAQPIRTDLNLNDTGVLQASGTWQRAETLRETPLRFDIAWNRPQLGQLTKLLSGRDQGWRGGLQVEVNLSGTPGKLRISSDASIQDFRRYDITNGSALRLAAHCDAEYSSVDRMFREVMCGAPVGGGLITLKGEAGLPASHAYDLSLGANEVPAAAIVALGARAKKDLPGDLAGSGSMNGRLSVIRRGESFEPQLEGSGEITDFRLASAENKSEIGPVTLPFIIASEGGSPRRRAGSEHGQATRNGPHFEFGPFAVLGPRLVAQGWVNRSGYRVALAGEGEIAKTLRIARMLGLPALHASADGSAQLDFQIGGNWASEGAEQGFLGPQVVGTAKLRNVRIAVRGTGGPVEVATADLKLTPEEAQVEKLSAKVANTSWTGSLEMPRGCGTPAACEIHFNLNANQLAMTSVSDWASPQPNTRPWYRVLESGSSTQPSFLGSLQASGRITVDHFQIHNVSATRVTANVAVDRGKLSLSDITAEVLGGKYQGEWETDFREKPAVSTSSGSFQSVMLAGVAPAMRGPGISGTASGSYQLTGDGRSSAEFWQSAEGTVRFDVRQGNLSHVALEENEESLKIARLSGQARLHSGKIELKDATLDSADGKFTVSGTASFDRELDVKLTGAGEAARGYAITGSLASPQVKPSSVAEQARLKK